MLHPKHFFSAFILMIISSGIYCQDIHFSQFYQSPLTLNPALAGSANALRTSLQYKNQWSSVASPYKTIGFSFDINVVKKSWKNGFLGTGFSFFSDKAGDTQMGTTNVDFSISSGLKIGQAGSLSMGIQSSYVQKSINVAKLQSGMQYVNGAYNSALPTGETLISSQRSVFDVSAGMQWSYGKSELFLTKSEETTANLGIAFFHINRPDQALFFYSTEILYMKMIIHGSAHIGLPIGTISLVPSFLIASQGKSKEVTAGTSLRYQLKQDSKYTGYMKSSSVLIGGHYRWKDAFILSTMYETAGFGFGISYDINISPLREASNGKGGLELSLKFVNLGGPSYKR